MKFAYHVLIICLVTGAKLAHAAAIPAPTALTCELSYFTTNTPSTPGSLSHFTSQANDPAISFTDSDGSDARRKEARAIIKVDLKALTGPLTAGQRRFHQGQIITLLPDTSKSTPIDIEFAPLFKMVGDQAVLDMLGITIGYARKDTLAKDFTGTRKLYTHNVAKHYYGRTTVETSLKNEMKPTLNLQTFEGGWLSDIRLSCFF